MGVAAAQPLERHRGVLLLLVHVVDEDLAERRVLRRGGALRVPIHRFELLHERRQRAVLVDELLVELVGGFVQPHRAPRHMLSFATFLQKRALEAATAPMNQIEQASCRPLARAALSAYAAPRCAPSLSCSCSRSRGSPGAAGSPTSCSSRSARCAATTSAPTDGSFRGTRRRRGSTRSRRARASSTARSRRCRSRPPRTRRS